MDDMSMKVQLRPGLQLHFILWVFLLRGRSIFRDSRLRDQSSSKKPIVPLGRDVAGFGVLEIFSIFSFAASTHQEKRMKEG